MNATSFLSFAPLLVKAQTLTGGEAGGVAASRFALTRARFRGFDLDPATPPASFCFQAVGAMRQPRRLALP
jgi:hypothetical protein